MPGKGQGEQDPPLSMILVVTLLIVALLYLLGGNGHYQTMPDTYQEAVLSLPDGTHIAGAIDSWSDLGDRVELTIEDVTYCVSWENVILIRR